MALVPNIRCVLLDVEGTTTPIAFVHETLFPFAAERLEACCGRVDDPRVAAAIDLLRREHAQDSALASDDEFGDGRAYLEQLMAADRKSTGLKALQGVIWEEGYRQGTLLAPVFDDVPPALGAWRKAGIGVRIYSSGSVLAQKLLFAHTTHGDLTPWIDGYYDSTTGPKKQAESYRAIARHAELGAESILFLSDSRAELDASREAGMASGMLRRPGNSADDSGRHPEHLDFSSLLP